MPLDPYLVSRLHLLEGLEVSPESLKDEALWERVREFNVDPSPWSMPDLTLTELDVPGPHGPVPVRIYEPKNRDPIGCLLWVHGGGFTSGSVDSNEAHVVSTELAARAGAKVVSVDYRLRPRPCNTRCPSTMFLRRGDGWFRTRPAAPKTRCLPLEGPARVRRWRWPLPSEAKTGTSGSPTCCCWPIPSFTSRYLHWNVQLPRRWRRCRTCFDLHQRQSKAWSGPMLAG
jgi:hypothetical protein